MREILFRGKRTDNGEWVVSNSIMQTNYSGTFLWYKGCWGEAESVGEYTGLTDKKGNKIFEGDIVQVNAVANAKIIYNDQKACFVFDYGANGRPLVVDLVEEHSIEVIGNIHDNPELLEEK